MITHFQHDYIERFFKTFSVGSVFKVKRSWLTGGRLTTDGYYNNKIGDLIVVVGHHRDGSVNGNRVSVLQIRIDLVHEIWISSSVAEYTANPQLYIDDGRLYLEKITE
jgi:hypothetical protein